MNPSPMKNISLVKPDFSPLIESEKKFGKKLNGSYKKQIFIEPESPIKVQNSKFMTPLVKGKNLFGELGKCNLFRKLNFDDIPEENNDMFSPVVVQENKENFQIIPNLNIKMDLDDILLQKKEKPESPLYTSFNTNKKICKEDLVKNHLKNQKFENEFSIVRTIKGDKFVTIYKVINNESSEVFCIKKVHKNSAKFALESTIKIHNDLQKNTNFILGSEFCLKDEGFWVEEEDNDDANIHSSNKSLYILYPLYKNGDILDYLERLEKYNYYFTNEFYWDIIFEMIIGLQFLHLCGYLHLNIKPANFLVDQKGYICLSDFGLAQKINELTKKRDIEEGDSAYISKEFFSLENPSDLNAKTDIFSLGLTFLEILAKIDLPSNGEMWKAIRRENFEMPQEFLTNWNIKNNTEFLSLIKDMINSNEKKRPNLSDLINNYPQLQMRYQKLQNRTYKKTVCIPSLSESSKRKESLGMRTIPSSNCLPAIIEKEEI